MWNAKNPGAFNIRVLVKDGFNFLREKLHTPNIDERLPSSLDEDVPLLILFC
jgi:hypothetical protein